MTLCEDINNQFHGKGNSDANEVIRLLKTQGEIEAISEQKNGEGLYVRFSKEGYFNFSDISKTLYNKFNLCVRAFDQDSGGTRNVWLTTKNYLANH